jgi:hypothetical protein
MESNNNYSIQQYITVFWEFNKNDNEFTDELFGLIDDINNDLSNDKKEQINKYIDYISSIKGLRGCIDKLSTEYSKNIFDKYNNDFINKVTKIYEFIIKTTEQELDLNNFINFMYENSAEGRITKQNNDAFKYIQKIIDVELYIKNLNT